MTITSPQDGAVMVVGSEPSFSASATDAEDGDIGESIEWTSSIDGDLGAGPIISPPALSVGSHTITASVQDGDGASASDEVTFTVEANAPPEVTISAPSTDTTVIEGETITLEAEATDPEDGDLSDGITWSSSTDGDLGSGSSVTVTPSMGSHVISARVEDSHGAEVSASVVVSVGLAPESAPISSRWTHTCALDSGGAAFCWGRNDYGQIGDGSQTDAESPTAVSGGLTFDLISVGDSFSCGLTPSGAAYCWGHNGNSELGSQSVSGMQSTVPVRVSGGHSFVTLSSGGAHTCALTALGEAYCWGYNGNGEIGNGDWESDQDATTPDGVVGGHRFVDIATRKHATCGISVDGPTYCWGSESGLGIGSTDGVADSPVMVSGNVEFTELAGGSGHMCGLDSSGAAYCWGTNEDGQVGNGNTELRVDAPTPVVGGLTFVQIVGGARHTCGVASAGAAYCWGTNGLGELGIGSMDPGATSPQPVAGGLTFESLAAAWRHTCGMTTSGDTYCWGDGYRGTLGDGEISSRTYEPIQTDPF